MSKVAARTNNMTSQFNKLFLIWVCVVCVLGIVVTATLQIHSIIAPSGDINNVPYVGYLFAAFILGGVWSVYLLQRIRSMQVITACSAIKIILSSFGIAGVFYFLAYAVSLVCCGVEGVRFVNANIFSFFAVGIIFSLPIVKSKE